MQTAWDWCHTRLAPWVRSLARKFNRTLAPRSSSLRLGIEATPRDTERPHNQSAGQISQCRHELELHVDFRREVGRGFSSDVSFGLSLITSRLSRAIFSCSGFI